MGINEIQLQPRLPNKVQCRYNNYLLELSHIHVNKLSPLGLANQPEVLHHMQVLSEQNVDICYLFLFVQCSLM